MNASRMWHTEPASEYMEGYPIGNGVLAAMVLGSFPQERIALNHEWLWRAKGRSRDFGPRHQHLAEIRSLFFEGKTFEAGTLANERLGGVGGVLAATGHPNRVDPYQPAGDLLLDTGIARALDYSRELDLATGIVTVWQRAESSGDAADQNSSTLLRQCFAHATRKIICVHLSTSQPGHLDIAARLHRVEDPECELTTLAHGSEIRLTGRFIEGSSFCVLARLFPEGGRSSTDGDRVCVTRADELLIVLAIGVAHDGEDPEAMATRDLSDVPADWDTLLDEHTERFSQLYGRVSLELDEDVPGEPTDERLAALRDRGEDARDLIALYFNFGRYLLLSSSLMGELPANLQGKWNEDLNPPWECDLHHDVNLQMNYWPAEVCNMPECTEALFRHIERFVPHARRMAKALYNCRGVWFPIQTDPWGRATPESRGYDVWTGAAAWLAQHMWWRYEYGGDLEFLRERAYPFLKEVAAFYEDFLVPLPESGDRPAYLVPVPSQSPENRFVGGVGPVSLCVAATMDLVLIRDVLTHAIQASEILGLDGDLRETWREILEAIPPLQVGRHGQLQEWFKDYEEEEPGHRHYSHLVGLFPGDQLTFEHEPVLTQAARMSLFRRLAAGGGHTGWSRAWTVCMLARLGDASHALIHLRHLIHDFSTVSLLDLHPPRIFQIDGNLGGTAGVAEMLLQSHAGTIRLLPALPRAWPDGRIAGLMARGGFEVDMVWREGALAEAVVRARRPGACRLQYGSTAVSFETQPGDVLRLDGSLKPLEERAAQ